MWQEGIFGEGEKKKKYKGKRALALSSGSVGCSALVAWSRQKGKARQIIPEYPAFKYAGALGTQEHVGKCIIQIGGVQEQTANPSPPASNNLELLCYKQKFNKLKAEGQLSKVDG